MMPSGNSDFLYSAMFFCRLFLLQETPFIILPAKRQISGDAS